MLDEKMIDFLAPYFHEEFMHLLGKRCCFRVIDMMSNGSCPFDAMRDKCEEISANNLSFLLEDLKREGIISMDGDMECDLTEDGHNFYKSLTPFLLYLKRRLIKYCIKNAS